MRIIALQGKHDTGKTTTLNKLIDLVKKHDSFCCVKILDKDGRGGERRCWATSIGVKIGITTRGDAIEVLRADFYEKKNNFRDRDIVVCAVRSKGKTVDFVKEQAQDGLTIFPKQVASSELQNSTNEGQANAILAELLCQINELEGTV